MGAKRWNAGAYHRSHGRRPRGFRLDPRATLSAGLFAILVIASGAVAMGHMASDDDGRVGICHTTGDQGSGYVFLIVDRDGAEHGHHKSHPRDKIDVASEADCGPQPGSAAATDQPTAACSHLENESTPEDSGLCAADVSIEGNGSLQGNQAVFRFLVRSLGPDEANEVLVNATLPDVGRPWTLAGPDAGSCDLTGREFTCDFDDLLAQEERPLEATALRCPQDCGEDLTARARVTAYNDGNASNDEANAVLVIPECGKEPPSSEPAPPSSSEPTPPGNNSTAPPQEPPGESDDALGNGTAPPPANDTGGEGTPSNDSGPASEEPANGSQAAPESADVALHHWAEQDDEQVVFRFEVQNLGPGPARNVVLTDPLPDVRRSWFLGGEAASVCTLEGRALRCDFGSLQPGEARSLYVKAYTDRLPCGEHRTNTAFVSADNDSEARNDRSSAGIQARAC